MTWGHFVHGQIPRVHVTPARLLDDEQCRTLVAVAHRTVQSVCPVSVGHVGVHVALDDEEAQEAGRGALARHKMQEAVVNWVQWHGSWQQASLHRVLYDALPPLPDQMEH